jgi:hypothetical protein
MRIEWAVIVVAVLCAFGAAFPGYYMVADDVHESAMMHYVARDGAGLGGKIYRVAFQAEGVGHFRPVQDVLYVVAYHVLGVDRWMSAIVIVYSLCHVASAWLLLAILRRLGASRTLSFVAATLFALHPVWDDNLACNQFGNNVPGLAAVLAACLLWLPPGGEASRGRAWRLGGAAVMACLAIGLGVNYLVSAPVILGTMAVAIAWRRRSFRDLVARGAALGAALLVSVAHRYFAYGRIGTVHSAYQDLRPGYDPLPFLAEMFDAAFRLRPSPTATYTAGLNPRGVAWDDGTRPAWSADTLAVIGIAGFVIAAVVFVATRADAARGSGAGAAATRREEPFGGRLLPAFAWGLLLTVAMLLPYYLFIGRSGLHRYLYPAIAGLAVLATFAAGAAGRVLARIAGDRIAAALGLAALLVVLGALVREDRAAARSIATAHRITRSIVSALHEELTEHPEVTRIFTLGYPRALGRAGYTVSGPGHLPALLEVKTGRFLRDKEKPWFAARLDGSVEVPLRPDTALFVVEPDGVTVRRVPSGAEDALPPHAMSEQDRMLYEAWRLHDDRELRARLATGDRGELGLLLRVLDAVDGGWRNPVVYGALAAALGPHPAGARGAPGYEALPSPASAAPILARAVSSRWPGSADLAATLLESAPDDPDLGSAVLAAARLADPASGMALAAALAARAEPGSALERDALAVIGARSPKADMAKVRGALEQERKARALARDLRTADVARQAFEAALATSREAGVTRDDLHHHVAFCRVAHLDDPGLQATLRDWTARGWRHLVAPLESWLAARGRPAIDGVSLGLAPAPGRDAVPGRAIEVQVVVENRSDLDLPGGVSPISARLGWSWSEERPSPPGFERWFGPEGIPPGTARRAVCVVRVPDAPSSAGLVFVLHAFGKVCARSEPLALPPAEPASRAPTTR